MNRAGVTQTVENVDMCQTYGWMVAGLNLGLATEH